MSGLVDEQSLEAQISDCCQAIYRATEPATALSNWARLRDLKSRKSALEDHLFDMESRNRELRNAMTLRSEQLSTPQRVYSSWRRRPK